MRHLPPWVISPSRQACRRWSEILFQGVGAQGELEVGCSALCLRLAHSDGVSRFSNANYVPGCTIRVLAFASGVSHSPQELRCTANTRSTHAGQCLPAALPRMSTHFSLSRSLPAHALCHLYLPNCLHTHVSHSALLK